MFQIIVHEHTETVFLEEEGNKCVQKERSCGEDEHVLLSPSVGMQRRTAAAAEAQQRQN